MAMGGRVTMNNVRKQNGETQYHGLVQQITALVENAKQKAAQSVGAILIETYWNVGRYIVEFEQGGNVRAKYGDKLLVNLSKDLTLVLGKGYSKSNLFNMRLFYSRFPIFQTSGKLSWSHIVELVGIDDKLEREFYLAETINANWAVRELKRQKERGLFMQLALGKSKKHVLALAKSGNVIEKPEDAVKSTYILDFLNIPEPKPSEGALEDALISNLENFLLELGKGFAFVGRQYRLTINNENYYADLVFYHVILKCYVVIDLKIGKVQRDDISQMNMYLGYFAIDKTNEGDNPPIGIVLAKEKNDVMVEYATYGMNSKLFVSKYQLYLPNVEELRNLLFRQINGEQQK
jgi:predicted nuclease of restriction endonuclease-like (RecB) superfamily